jgi:hypothetical protein
MRKKTFGCLQLRHNACILHIQEAWFLRERRVPPGAWDAYKPVACNAAVGFLSFNSTLPSGIALHPAQQQASL